MNKSKIETVTAIMLVVLLLLAPGCWGRLEMETLAYILVLGISSSPEGRVVLTAQVGLPSSEPGGGDEDTVIQNITAEGRDISDALENMYARTSRRPDLNHLRLIIVGEELAQDGMWHILDFLRRDVSIRLNVLAAVTSEDMEELLTVEDPLSSQPALAITTLFEIGSQRSLVVEIDLMNLVSQILEPDRQAVLPMVFTNEDRFELGESAVFQGERMVTTLDTEQTLGYLLWHDNVQGGVVTVPQQLPDSASFRILSSDTKVELDWDGTSLSVHANVTPLVDIVELHGREFSDLETLADHYFINRMADMVEVAQREGVDVLGLAARMRRTDAEVWNDLKDDWEDVLRNADYDLQAIVHIRGQGEIR